MAVSILNNVIGPVMPGSSSSHTVTYCGALSYREALPRLCGRFAQKGRLYVRPREFHRRVLPGSGIGLGACYGHSRAAADGRSLQRCAVYLSILRH